MCARDLIVVKLLISNLVKAHCTQVYVGVDDGVVESIVKVLTTILRPSHEPDSP